MHKKSKTLSNFINTLFLPIRLLISHEIANKLGLRSLRDERCDIVMEHCKGRLLDIGCGNNQLVKKYRKNSVGVDVYNFGGGALIVKDSSKLPFENGAFQTISFVASLNHIPNRREVIKESYRLLSKKGRVIITMLSPLLGKIRHKLAWWDRDQRERGIKEGEEPGLSDDYLISLMESGDFTFVKKKKFILGLNNLYIFEKKL